MNSVWQKKLPVFNRHLGVVIDDWGPDYVVIHAKIRPEYANNSGIPHGGFISALLDMATGHAGIYCEADDRYRLALTLSLSITYQGQAVGDSLIVKAEKTSGGRKIYYANAIMHDNKGNLVASAQAVCRYRTGSENVEGVPM